jgi:hypothetical protein
LTLTGGSGQVLIAARGLQILPTTKPWKTLMTVISFRHKLIFIKTVKTAGTSIEVDLSARVEPEAIVTPIIPAIDGHQPRNYGGGEQGGDFYNHMTAHEVRERLGPDRFDTFHSFAVEREPVSKCLSHFHMLKNRSDAHGLPAAEREALTWDEYVRQGRFPIDVKRYQDPDRPDQLLVNEILAYETLDTELPALLSRRGIHGFKLMARAKAEYGKVRHADLSTVTEKQRKTIYRAFAGAIALTGLYEDQARAAGV